ncbi:ATP-binding cassette domain-containing protein [Streptomyces sp. NPDC007863]|uniref:ATP-binding cassette domain-containing protein n=1 Tax=Streptomyces sp. NPDC007863 TaxID=3154894 RepID=UPI0033C07857
MTGTPHPTAGPSPRHTPGPELAPVPGPELAPVPGPELAPVPGLVAVPGRAPDRPPVVELSGVVKEYAGGVRALDGVDLTIGAGELVGIVGPSGSGKSTLLHIVGTLDRPTSGTVAIAGHDVARLTDRRLSALRARHIGFVFQAFHLAPGLSAVENVAEGLLYSGLPRSRRRALAAGALARVGLADRMRHRPHELSGGQKQRVAIARALVGQPDLLLADEPTGALDTASGKAVMELLRALNDEGATIAVITHDTDIAQRLPRQVRIRDGRVVADSTRGKVVL